MGLLQRNMAALMWLAFAAVLGTGQAQFPRDLKQYIGHVETSVALNNLRIKTIPNKAFENYSNITVRITLLAIWFISSEYDMNNPNSSLHLGEGLPFDFLHEKFQNERFVWYNDI